MAAWDNSRSATDTGARGAKGQVSWWCLLQLDTATGATGSAGATVRHSCLAGSCLGSSALSQSPTLCLHPVCIRESCTRTPFGCCTVSTDRLLLATVPARLRWSGGNSTCFYQPQASDINPAAPFLNCSMPQPSQPYSSHAPQHQLLLHKCCPHTKFAF